MLVVLATTLLACVKVMLIGRLEVELEEHYVFHCAIFIKYEGDTTVFSSKVLAQFAR